MNRERWRQIDTILKSALERPAGERAAFLDAACAGDGDLRREVESLMAHDESGSFIPTKPMPEAFAELVAGRGAGDGERGSGGGRGSGGRGGREGRGEHGASFSDSFDRGRFVAGHVLAERYRIITLLGRGGMGEVYKAEDLKLEQTVALKFLPESLSADGAALARLYREVRTARQISHRNVCRVYDIGETGGVHFLSMEFVPGEELASLLRRIGRLPADKAVEVSRQLCAGVAAAHGAGVLHRDLKPANVMIDDAGNVRVTDFGLAGLAEEFQGRDVGSGTPAYMAPEQLAGREVTARSDIYALGLVIYEIFTGRRAFEARTLDELLRLRASAPTPASPSSLVKDLDPSVERVINRCLEKEPERRPASALQVAAALPGGDPIAAALAAGETPSPEMVAAAPKVGSLRPPVAAALLAAVLFSVLALAWVSDRAVAYNIVPFDKPPEALADRAAALVRKLGYADAPVDTAYAFGEDAEYYRHVERHDQSATRWERLRAGRPALVNFWYRQSPRHLEPQIYFDVTPNDPDPYAVSGAAGVLLDTTGRLMEFYAVPPQVDEPAAASPAAPDWAALFGEAGLDITKFRPTEPRWTPPVYADARAAWEGVFPEQPETPLRVEAAGYRGRPVYFELVEPWNTPYRMRPYQTDTRFKLMAVILTAVFITVLLAGVWLARRNFRLGLGDRCGAFKLALFVFSTYGVGSLLVSSHAPTAGEFWLLLRILMECLFTAAVLWVFYIGLEPYVRRRTPHRIISWSRLLAGDWRDPLIGRDVLVGVILGVGLILLGWSGDIAGPWFGIPPEVQFGGPMVMSVSGPRFIAATFLLRFFTTLLQPLGLIFLTLLFSLVLRGEQRAAVGVWVLFTGVLWLARGAHLPALLLAAVLAAAYVFVLARFGLLAVAVAQFSLFMSEFYLLTTDLSAWHIGSTLFASGVLLALALYGFYTSLAGQPLFKRGLLEE